MTPEQSLVQQIQQTLNADQLERNPNLEDLDPAQAEMLKTILEIIDRRFEKEEKDGNKNI